MAGRGSAGPLTVAQRDRVLDALGVAVYHDGLSTTSELAARLGLNRQSVPRLLRLLHERAAKEGPSIADLRSTLLQRLDVQYARAARLHDDALREGDFRARADAIRAATDVVRTAGRLSGIESIPPATSAETPKFKISFESWETGAPPALLHRLQQLQSDSNATEIPQLDVALQDLGRGQPERQNGNGAARAVEVVDGNRGAEG